jgi:hypothetical protein
MAKSLWLGVHMGSTFMQDAVADATPAVFLLGVLRPVGHCDACESFSLC